MITKLYYKNPWDTIAAMLGGGLSVTIFGNSSKELILNLQHWGYSMEALFFILKAGAGALVAVFFKKAGEDLYIHFKPKLLKLVKKVKK